MNLGDLLTELRENILHDRSQRISGDVDHLWSDATLVRYINEAHRRFARLSLIIRDGRTSECCQITLKSGVSSYDLHPSVLAVLSAKLTGDVSDLARAGHSQFNALQQPTDPYWWDANAIANIPPGKPRAYASDDTLAFDDFNALSTITLSFYPTPDATYDGTVVNLRVCRLPLDDFNVSNLQAQPEIPADHQLEMLDWAAYLALRIVDRDMGDAKMAEYFRTQFDANVAKARSEVMRKLFAPQAWGFGRNGFAWEGSNNG